VTLICSVGINSAMKPSEAYFYRNRGSWDWTVDFRIQSYKLLWSASLSVVTKARLSMFAISQRLFGSFRMWTFVDYEMGASLVRHSTKMKKWGLTFYKSEKTFMLEDDGESLQLDGVEYFWPFLNSPVPFTQLTGAVQKSTTSATYDMPIAGTQCKCQSFLNKDEGYINIETPWLYGRFTLCPDSIKRLVVRFE
jgi:hypothetical protein